MINHFEKHRSFYQLLNDRERTYMLKDVIIDLCGPKPEYEAVQAYASAFVASHAVRLDRRLVPAGNERPSDELAALFKAQGL